MRVRTARIAMLLGTLMVICAMLAYRMVQLQLIQGPNVTDSPYSNVIREYDEILVMSDGKLISHGPYDRLVEECDYFRNICSIKFGSIS